MAPQVDPLTQGYSNALMKQARKNLADTESWQKTQANVLTGLLNYQPPSAPVGSPGIMGDVGRGAKGGYGSGMQGLVNYAKGKIGTPYSWGGGNVNGPSRGIAQGAGTIGFDCSSFVQNVFKNTLGINLPRTSQAQSAYGRPISAQEAKPGDLVYYGARGAAHHIGIYLGNGYYIDAPHTGARVRIEQIGNASGFVRVAG